MSEDNLIVVTQFAFGSEYNNNIDIYSSGNSSPTNIPIGSIFEYNKNNLKPSWTYYMYDGQKRIGACCIRGQKELTKYIKYLKTEK